MANKEHLAILQQGTKVWNQWRKENPNIIPDFSKANLAGINLAPQNYVFDARGNTIEGIKKHKAIWDDSFKGSTVSIPINLRNVIFTEADLTAANFHEADLAEADISSANLSNAIFTEANLYAANLSKSKVTGASFFMASLSNANLRDVDLSGISFKEVGINQETLIDEKWRLCCEIVNGQLYDFDLQRVDLSGVNLEYADLRGLDLRNANLTNVNFVRANLKKVKINENTAIDGKWRRVWEIVNQKSKNQNFRGFDFSGANLSEIDLKGFDFSDANFYNADLQASDLSYAQLRGANFRKSKINYAVIDEKWRRVWKIVNKKTNYNLKELDLTEANLCDMDFNGLDLSYIDFFGANLSRIQALGTNFTSANLTGACIEDWNINDDTKLDNVICDYVYLKQGQQERRPSSGKFAPGEFTQLFKKSLENLDLVFRNGLDWNAFAYSFKKLEVENQDIQLDVQSIEKKSDGVLLVRVNVTPNANKEKIHDDFMQGYEFAFKQLQLHHQARIEDKDKEINRLFNLVNQLQDQLGEVPKLLAENPRKVYNIYNSDFAGGIADAENIKAEQIGGDSHNTD